MQTFEREPLIKTWETPNDIIGYDKISLFTDFLKSSYNPFRNTQKYSDEILAGMAKLLQNLRDNGFYPNGIDDNGKVRWSIVLKSKVQIEMEKGLPFLIGKTRKELGAIANGKTIKSMP